MMNSSVHVKQTVSVPTIAIEHSDRKLFHIRVFKRTTIIILRYFLQCWIPCIRTFGKLRRLHTRTLTYRSRLKWLAAFLFSADE